MSNSHTPISDEQLDLYLDGGFSGTELAEFEVRLAQDSRARQLIAEQRLIDARLLALFSPPTPTIEQVEQLLDHTECKKPHRANPWLVSLTIGAIAAAITWFIVALQWNDGRDIEPFFAQRPLADLYEETVRQGFRPYYYCEDEERFALTFRKRQDVPLALEAMPEDRHMVGLSYLGGLSRDTTAMLSYVDEKPVVVFVDRKNVDNRELAEVGARQLHVHRVELGELVLYEVSPFETPKMSQYLKTVRK